MAISLFPLLLEQVARGNARPAQLLDQIKPNDTIRYNAHWARFMKRKPGDFLIEFGHGDEVVETLNAVAPVEAKLLVIDYLVDRAKETLRTGGEMGAEEEEALPDEEQPEPGEQEPAPAPRPQVHRGQGPRRR